MTFSNFSQVSFTWQNSTHKVYYQGKGPAVLILHELPGMTTECIELAERVAAQGFTVFLPLMFGKPGRSSFLSNLIHVCISREFRCLARHESSPITNWLRALCREVYPQCGGRGVGAIGMCITGGFVLSMMLEPEMIAPVICQPGLPFGRTKPDRQSLGMAPEELEAAKINAANGVPLLGFRFTQDQLCPAERFERLRQEFGEAFDGTEIPSEAGKKAYGLLPPHSVLTYSFVDEQGNPTQQAMDRVLTFLKQQLADHAGSEQ
ncbi:dienelactone hydrolase family protein [Trichocoleus sp. FACHB-591]|uniref:dienelactone hydrolase family protein n=1 Tax=Trichocoleus sp. FACHB-591 TaxID=2692872 RepID=UPI0016844C54|nr:dienelactone hydrolase family protein [Trichocoleus sp. FACHB-591]MBD2095604.1 dienelactone hydrolase family protein [Trichocoleus sp. FACHB-591]